LRFADHPRRGGSSVKLVKAGESGCFVHE
jgi:hypothetical protein